MDDNNFEPGEMNHNTSVSSVQNDANVELELEVSQMIEKLSLSHLNHRGNAVFPSYILTNHLLFNKILDSASPGTLMRLSRTCRNAKDLVKRYIPRAFDINTALLRFFPNPVAFRSMQAKTSTLISGSFALQFLGRLSYPRSDLDLYCNYAVRRKVGKWLIKEGYTFVPHPDQDPSFAIAVTQANHIMDVQEYSRMRSISTIFTFKKKNPLNHEEELRVQVVVAHRNPMEVILNFHSTCVMNVIAYDHAYSFYPLATFEEHISLYCTGKDPQRDKTAIEKYTARRFTFIYDWPAENPYTQQPYDEHIIPIIPRWIGDRYAWNIRLSLDGVAPPPPINRISSPLPTDPCYFTSWDLGWRYISRTNTAYGNAGRFESMRIPHPRIFYDVLATEGFSFRYVTTHDAKKAARLKQVAFALRQLHIVGREAAKWGLGHLDANDADIVQGEPLLFIDAELLRYCQVGLSAQGRDIWKNLY